MPESADLRLPPEAESRLPAAFRAACRNLTVAPYWLDADRFWYRRETTGLPEYVLVTVTGARRPAFDHAALRDALQDDAAFAALMILEIADGAVTLASGRDRWRFAQGQLTPLAPRPNADDESLSPDGQWVLYREAGDLWLRPAAGGKARRLTDTAAPHFEWAKSPDQSLETVHLQRRGIRLPPVALWSPDSRRIFTYQLDERAVRRIALVQNVTEDGGPGPILHELRNAFAGDEALPIAHQAVIEVDSGRIVPCGPADVTETSGLEKREAWWSRDCTRIFWLEHDRHEREITLIETDAETGAARRVISETSARFADIHMAYGGMPNICLLDATDELIWFSQRDGYAHLYLCRLSTGAVIRQITAGDWPVVEVLAVNPNSREVIFLAGSGENSPDPYARRICISGLDHDTIRVLSPEAADHAPFLRELGWAELIEAGAGPVPRPLSPDLAHIVVTSATAGDLGETRLLRIADHTVVTVLESGSSDLDLVTPERVELLAADGETRLFGMLWRPVNMAADQRYPLLDIVYPGPQCIQTPRSALPHDEVAKLAMVHAATALGIAVLMMDGRGTPWRSKAFHDLCHGNLSDPGFLSDHVAAYPQLAGNRPWLDLSRIGIMGHSAGGHAAARAILAHPGTYRAAVSTAGSHDLTGYNRCWPEKWQGPLIRNPDGSTSYDSACNARLAHALEGKLLIGLGDMDENVLPALSLQLAAALTKAGKCYDMLIAPNDDHATFKSNPWVQRRLLDWIGRALTDPSVDRN
ncbi:DPP IV N-terminal domain-containing protein [Rhodobacter sp. 24-YEA-8]|uniref:S9 family peptidase n=1 Tax=Rhodobacter sp. 24-YEA-8 TaxID=1884310 RepID=UPI000896C474|nr:DPP IV N-terminal domain-containing protein [Rhodobacter sp. 24-YEA-8]SED73564.1 Prolyl oligopeptidase family protein [Rhodobacter sp. 24-YEA-8]